MPGPQPNNPTDDNVHQKCAFVHSKADFSEYLAFSVHAEGIQVFRTRQPERRNHVGERGEISLERIPSCWH